MSGVFLFPGQGAESPGMGGASLRRPGPVRGLLERASAALRVDLVAIITRGDPALARTEVGQPALIAVSLGLALEQQAAGLIPTAVAGHSVGEIAAFCLAGCLAPEVAVDCVIERARLMAQAARQVQGGMAAVRVDSEAAANDAIALGLTAGKVELAAHNGPEEWVLTGDRRALAAIAVRFPTVPLPVSGPWHSQAMAEAGAQWRTTLEAAGLRPPRLPVVANADGGFVRPGADLVQLLAGQLTQPVRWAESLATLARAGATRWHVFGPGRVLRGLCRANLSTACAVQLHDGATDEELRA